MARATQQQAITWLKHVRIALSKRVNPEARDKLMFCILRIREIDVLDALPTFIRITTVSE